MCGIAGVFNVPRFTVENVESMIGCIRYRGPDEQGAIKVGPAVLGHARLAVVDPENGTQPMSNEDDTVWVIFNGEIYNFIELREELKSKGYKFKSRCDTEVLVHLWREEGEAMLQRLIGMFAFFIWDTKQNKGMLARDRQGIKPCYYMDIDNGFAFGSEIKTILSLPGIDPDIDNVGLNLVHTFNYCPPPRTCYKGIQHVEPGTYWLIDGDGKREVKRYWSWSMDQEKRHVSEEEFSDLLDDAIRLQMRFDVKGCLFLSGGVDSSVIGAHLKKQWNEPDMLCFGLDCTVPGYGEFEYALQAAKAIGVDVTPVTYDESIVTENIQNFLFHADQPHGDFSFMLIRKLCQAAHDAGVIVAFNGDGPDEILSGFTHNQDFLSKHCGTALPISDYFSRISYLSEDKRGQLLDVDFARSLPDPVNAFRSLMDPYAHLSAIDQIASYEAAVLGPGNNLIKTDRMGAGLSIEGRSPFLDHRMSELMTLMPMEQRFNGDVSKYFLKKFGLRHFDKDFMFRRKSMPTLPIGEWIKGPLKDWAHDTIADLDPSRYQVANARTLLEKHVSGEANNTRELRTLLTTSVWMSH